MTLTFPGDIIKKKYCADHQIFMAKRCQPTQCALLLCIKKLIIVYVEYHASQS